MSTQLGTIALIDGQQSYSIIFNPAFDQVPVNVFLTLAMPNSSGESFSISFDVSSLTENGVTAWLSGIPSAASVGGYIYWEATDIPTSTPTPSVTTNQGGITVPQLFHRIGRRSRTGDYTKLSLTEQTDILEAANAALQKLYNALPVYFKELTEGFVLPAPLAISGVGVTQYSKVVTANTFTSAQFGCTVQLDGDPQWNQVIGTGLLLNPYMGGTGTVGGTVYGDAIFSDIYPLDRIIGNPRFPNQGGWPVGPITQIQSFGQPNWIYQQSIGTPVSWWTQTFGQSQGHAPFVVIKFAPLPNQAYPVNVRIGFWPKRLTFADYQNGATVVVPSQFIEPCFIPGCLEAFMSSPAWLVRGDEDRVWQNARDGENFLRQQPGQIGAPSNKVGTPLGY